MQLMTQKRNQQELQRSHDAMQGGTSPTHIGDGYQQQLHHMQERERLKQQHLAQWANAVSSPARQKQLESEHAANAQVQASHAMLNQRAQLAHEYHQRVKAEHQQHLLEQMSSDKRQKAALDHALRQAEASEAHALGLFNNQYNATKAEQKSQAMKLYKQELDAQIVNRQAMKAYGNMTSVEKEMNKDELTAFKKYDTNDLTLVPGQVSSKRFADPRPQKHSPLSTSAKAATIAVNQDKLHVHEERLQQYGILNKHTTPNTRHGQVFIKSSLDIAGSPVQTIAATRGTPQPLKQGSLASRDAAMGAEPSQQNRLYAPRAHQRHHSLMVGTPEASLNGLAPISITQNPDQAHGAQQPMLRSGRESRNSLQPAGAPFLGEGSPHRLKAEVNTANGGVGVSYSNVVLAGGIDPRERNGTMASSYKATYSISGSNQQLLPSLYSKGLEFNAKQKYDYNILNGQSLS